MLNVECFLMTKALDLWLLASLRSPRWQQRPGTTTDILFAICDHFEPLHGTDRTGALDRIQRWQREYPPLVQPFRDADGCSPKHTFFYPVEQYDPEFLKRIDEICRETSSEIELHLHHEGDSAATLRDKLERGKDDLARHGALPEDAAGRIRFGFVHGNWALAHSHPSGRHCGVPEELSVLKKAGCYADLTLPSAPDRTQTRTVNQIYYASTTSRPKPHDHGIPARVGDSDRGELLLVQGPLALNWRRRKGGIFPRIENSELSGSNPPRPDRLQLWLQSGIGVAGQPDWLFIKLHTHGGLPRNMRTLLGEAMPRFYEHFQKTCSPERGFRTHFVTAREMVNIIHAAENGHTGNAGQFRNYRYTLRSGSASRDSA